MITSSFWVYLFGPRRDLEEPGEVLLASDDAFVLSDEAEHEIAHT